MALSIDKVVTDLASHTFNVVTWKRLIDGGVQEAAIRRRIGNVLTPFTPGVYIVGEPSRRTLLFAALESIPTGAASRSTAAGLLDLPIDKVDQIQIVIPHGLKRVFEGPFDVRQSKLMPDADFIVARGFRCTSVERTICDLGTDLMPSEIQGLIEWSITNRRMTRSSFQACARAYCRRGRQGSGLIRHLNIALLDDEPFPASKLEQLGVRLFRRGRLGAFVLHFEPPWSDGVTGIVDIAWPELRVIVELDGRRWHAMSKAQSNDRARDRKANAHGWFVLRFGWQEITERPEAVLAELGRFLEARRAALAA